MTGAYEPSSIGQTLPDAALGPGPANRVTCGRNRRAVCSPSPAITGWEGPLSSWRPSMSGCDRPIQEWRTDGPWSLGGSGVDGMFGELAARAEPQAAVDGLAVTRRLQDRDAVVSLAGRAEGPRA